MLNILLIDDDKDIGVLLTKYLEKNLNCKVTYLEATKKAYALIKENSFDCIILDYLMPDENGFTFLKNIRKDNHLLPVIMLSAYSDVEKRIEGLSIGADDYLGKPFEPEELLLRINNVSKRNESQSKSNQSINETVIKYNDEIFYNPKLRKLQINGKSIELSESAHVIFVVLFKNYNNEISKKEIVQAINKDYSIETINTLNVTIMRLRDYLKRNIGEDIVIKTIRNKGYMLVVNL